MRNASHIGGLDIGLPLSVQGVSSHEGSVVLRWFGIAVAGPCRNSQASIGHRQILWHLMKYFAHFGHKDFILCLGHRGDLIKNYFLNYDECVSNDFVLSNGGKTIELASRDISDWRITFADTGLRSNIGQRLMAVEKYLTDEDAFLASYADGLTDLDLATYLDYAREQDKIASFLCVKPNLSNHIVQTGPGGLVTGIKEFTQSDIRINAGLFVLKRDIFKYMRPGDELVIQPFQRLIQEKQEKQLTAFEYDGFSLRWIHSRTNSSWTISTKAASRLGSLEGCERRIGEGNAPLASANFANYRSSTDRFSQHLARGRNVDNVGTLRRTKCRRNDWPSGWHLSGNTGSSGHLD
jgi:glucose-1-phosphate cytidylyltransferase